MVAHGASEHGARYDRFARFLTTAGYACYAIDHQGHGESAASTGRGRLGPRGMDGVLDDLGTLVDRAGRDAPGRPVYLFGHSMGSLIVQGFMERGGAAIAGYVLSGCPGTGDVPDAVRAGIEAAMAGGAENEPADLFGPMNEAFAPNRTAYDWLSRDPAEVDRYIEDPLCGDDMPLTWGFVAGMFGLVEKAMSPEGLARTPQGMPVLLVTGDRDPVSGEAVAVRALEDSLRAVGASVTAHYYEGGRHEMLNETNRDQVQADVLGWLDACVEGRD